MATDYEGLFQPPEGMEIPDEAEEETAYDVNPPSPTPHTVLAPGPRRATAR
jgi:hypothetical protein